MISFPRSKVQFEEGKRDRSWCVVCGSRGLVYVKMRLKEGRRNVGCRWSPAALDSVERPQGVELVRSKEAKLSA